MPDAKDATSKPNAEQAADQPQSQPQKSRKKLIIVIAGSAVFLQAAVIGIVKMAGPGPEEAAARQAEAASPATQPVTPEYEEIPLTQIKAPNEKTRQMFICDVKLAVRVEKKNAQFVKDIIAGRKAAIDDAVNRVIRAAELDDLRQDDLAWFRTRCLAEFERIAEQKGLIDQLYVPLFMKVRVD